MDETKYHLLKNSFLKYELKDLQQRCRTSLENLTMIKFSYIELLILFESHREKGEEHEEIINELSNSVQRIIELEKAYGRLFT